MTEYIDRAAAVRILEAKSDMAACTDVQLYFMAAAKMIGLLPSADVAPVIHARWIDNGRVGYAHAYFCGHCGWIDGHPIEDRHKYCPNCGAKMDESEDEE